MTYIGGSRGPPPPSGRGEPPRLVLFDVDDTLYDHTHATRHAITALRQRFPALRSFEPDPLVDAYQRELAAVHPRVVRGELTPEAARAERFRRFLTSHGLPARPADVAAASEVARAGYRQAERAVPGTEALLRALRGRVRLGILSNNVRSTQVAKLETLGIRDFFDPLVTSEDLPWGKPDPRAFRRAVRLGHATPATTVMVGDSWSDDVEGAIRAGVTAVWLDRSGERRTLPAGVRRLGSWRPTDRAAAAILRPRGAARPNRS